MSERILRALMQLFAIIAKVDEVTDPTSEAIESSNGRRIVEAFLRTELNDELLQKYIQLLNSYWFTTRDPERKTDSAKEHP